MGREVNQACRQYRRRSLGAVFALASVIALSGCRNMTPSMHAASTHPGSMQAPIPDAAAPVFTREVAGIEVRDASGAPYEFPFLGGLDVPRPHFIDIDGDGDFDLFVQEQSNALMFFENTGTKEKPLFVWRTDRYQNLDVGEWTRFVDIDRDGDQDLLAEEPYSYIRLFRNDGGKTSPKFVLAVDSLRDSLGRPIFSDRQNIPNLTDIDCDGLYDLFLGRVEGTITRYEQVRGTDGIPRFEFVTDRFEDIEIIGQIGSMHGANTMYFSDYDGDGDADLFWGDFFEDGILLIQNTGTCSAPVLRNPPVAVQVDGAKLSTSGYNVPVLVDIDADGDLDMFVGVLGGAFNPNRTAADNFYFIERQDGAYTLRTRRFLSQIDVGNESVPAFGDIDGDGDLDLLIGNKLDAENLTAGRLYVFRNTGSTTKPAFVLADTLDLDSVYHYAPALGDLDGDGDLDLVLGTWNNGIQFHMNLGTPTEPRWVKQESLTLTLTRGSNATPALVDIDGDGDLDLFVGEASGELNFYRNVGSAREPKFVLESDKYADIDFGRRSHPAFADLDGDGDYDLIGGREEGGAVYYRNDGTRREPKFVLDPSLAIDLPHNGAPVFVDIDRDRKLDLFAGGLNGGLRFFRRK